MTKQEKGKTVKIMVASGSLGANLVADMVVRGVAEGAQAIVADAGSTDSGAAPLATGVSKISRAAVKRDLRVLMRAALPARIPVIIGSCGTAGTDIGVDWTRDIALEIAREEGMNPRIALIYSEQEKSVLRNKLKQGKIGALAPLGPMTDDLIESCDHIVAMMGAEPYMKALQEGADIILGGRTTDTALISSFALLHGAGPGAAWHAAKTSECAGLCTESPRSGPVMVSIGEDFFDVESVDPTVRCTPHTISAHMLYENSNPFRLVEPSGILDVSNAKYEALTDRIVRVTNSVFEKKEYTMKLEGARGGPFQSLMLVGIEDPLVLSSIDLFLERLHQRLTTIVNDAFPDLTDFDLSLRPYGWNAVSGAKVDPSDYVPREIGLLLVVSAPTQEIATGIAKACNNNYLHFPLRKDIPQPSYGFAFSPADVPRGQVYQFMLNHTVAVDDPLELVRIKWVQPQTEDRKVA
jgi:hypothetical protein